MVKKFLLVLPLCTALLAAAPPPNSIIGSKLPEFSIEDQYERIWKSSSFRGRATVFVLTDREGYEYSTNWTKALVTRFKDSPVRFVPVADVQIVPGFLKGLIRGKFQDEFKYSILLDWEGVLVNALNVAKGVPNLVIVDKHGIIQHTAYGQGTRSQVEGFAQRLNQLLAAG